MLTWWWRVPRFLLPPVRGRRREEVERGGRVVERVYRFVRSSAEEVARKRLVELGAIGERVRVRRGEVCAVKRKVSVKVVGSSRSPVEGVVGAGVRGIEAMKPWRVFSYVPVMTWRWIVSGEVVSVGGAVVAAGAASAGADSRLRLGAILGDVCGVEEWDMRR